MYLKSLKLVGFKSFADRTRLELRPGVTVIVGPNGSGKSNIVDAVAWVMGTQAPSTLRTSKMEDVIFAGTATRTGLGRAEVTMVLDNSAGDIPMDLPEVSITRRLYRDGSSDYEINGVSCRLMDIQELLADSSIGKHQHVIIGQGQIDTILNATPAEHRAIIEEAAGIHKHRMRKDRALARLERTALDSARVGDIVTEIARQMRPLKRQAEAADRHAGIAASARSLRLYLAGEDLRRMTARRAGLEADRERSRAAIVAAEGELTSVGETLAVLRHQAGVVGEALDRDSSAAARMETTIERLRRLGQVAHERRRALETRIEGAVERRNDLEAELQQLSADFREAAADEGRAKVLEEHAESTFRRLELEERSLADQEGTSVEGALAIVRGDLRSLQSAADRDETEMKAVVQRHAVVQDQLARDRSEMRATNQEIMEIDVLVGASDERYRRAETDRKLEQDAWEDATGRLNTARVRLAASRARVEAIEAAVGGMADPQARSIVENSAGAAGSIASLLDVPIDHAAAVDAALGVWSDAVAFSDRDAMADAIGVLKGSGRGGVPLLSPRAGQDVKARTHAKTWGVTALVDVLGPAANRDLANALLGDVLVVEGWAIGWRIVSETPGIRAVTPEGDLISAQGVRVANPDGATPAMLETALADLEEAERDLARSQSLATQKTRAFEAARVVERDSLEVLEALETRLAGATETLGRLGRSVASAQTELERLDERRSALAGSAAGHDEARIRLEVRLAALEGEEADRQRAWEEMIRRRREVSAAREEARSNWQDASASRHACGERRSLLAQRSAAVRAELETWNSNPPDPDRLDRLGVISERSVQALEALRVHVSTLRDRQATLREEAGETGRQLGESQERYQALTRQVSDAKETGSASSIELAEIAVRREALAEALRRDLDAGEDEAQAEPRPEGDDLVGMLAEREAQLRRMGPINPLAREEYHELEQRHAFLVAQLDDLEKSARELGKVIKALDDEISSQFATAFEEISASFAEFFGVLFPGGRGRIALTDRDQPLTSPVEIVAQPMGKKLTKMSLLSGGERSLASLAFLFAVFKSRPSPFYLLDEVEAALDDSNLHRFLRLLATFRNGAQLIVVTHQQQTMEVADVLYGVTMEPGGSSRVVSKSLSHLEVLSPG